MRLAAAVAAPALLSLTLCLCLHATAAPEKRPASSAQAEPAEESHEAALLDGARVGHVTTTTQKLGDGKQLRSLSVMQLTVRRYGSTVRLRREEGDTESADGNLVAVSMRQGAAGGKQLALAGTVEDDALHVKVDGGRIERRLRWPGDVLSLRQQHRLFAVKKPRPGEVLTFRRYEPTYNAVLTVRATVKQRESVDVLGKKQSLLRVEMLPDRLEAPGQTVRPPKVVWWLDDDYLPVRRQVEIDGLGALLLVRTSREVALAAPGAIATPDIGTRSLVSLNRAIAKPYETKLAIYLVSVRDEDDLTLLCQDAHQQISSATGTTFELIVRPARPGKAKPADKTRRPSADFLGSSHFIDHGDERVQELARRAVGTETDAWKKAVRIERYVKNAMRTDNAAALVPASQVARTLKGDCRHHAFLTAALCRAQGLPARTAIGLLYVHRNGGPKLGFHTWAEVWVDGQWLGLDSTLGRGGVSAAHVKVNDHSWAGVQSLTPLLPASRAVGRLKVEVLRSE